MNPKGKYQNCDSSRHCLTDLALKCLIERGKMERGVASLVTDLCHQSEDLSVNP